MGRKAFLVALLLQGCGGLAVRPARSRGGADFTVMTYNVNFGLAGDGETLEAIGRADADLVLLQETNPGWQASIERRLGHRYPSRWFHHAGGAGGLAVLSRFPIRVLDVLPARVGWFDGARIVARTPGGPVQVLLVHLRPAISDGGSVVSGAVTTPPIRRAEIEGFYAAVDRSLPTLVAGDLNEGAAGRAVAFLEAQGLTDVLPELGDGSTSTWRYRTSIGTVRLPLDHVLCNGLLNARWARVDRTGRSDHLPVVAAFTVAAPARPRGR